MCCFPPAAPMSDIFNLMDTPSWVGTHMTLGLHKPQTSILQIISKLLQDKALEEGEEYISIKPLDPRGSGIHSTPKRVTQPSSSVARTGNPSYGKGGYGKNSQGTGRGGSWGKGQTSQPKLLFSLKLGASYKSRGLLKPTCQTSAGSVVRWGI